jgi:AraC-like DNA-binding protein
MSEAMWISLRSVDVPSLDVQIARSILRHPSFVARLAEYRGAVVEDRLFAASTVGTTTLPLWPLLVLPLAGSAAVRHGATASMLHPRDVLFLPSGAGFSARSAPGGTRVWILQWDPAVFGSPGAASRVQHRLGTSDFERLRSAIELTVAAGYSAHDNAAALVRVLSALRALGLHDARPAAADLELSLPEPLVRLGIAIDSALSSLSRAPAAIDLQQTLACSPAQLRRLIHRYGASAIAAGHAAASPPSWRDLLNGWRLAVGVLLMTSPHSRTERVAEQLGYASPTSFCHAFANAALPSPGNVRRVVDALA